MKMKQMNKEEAKELQTIKENEKFRAYCLTLEPDGHHTKCNRESLGDFGCPCHMGLLFDAEDALGRPAIESIAWAAFRMINPKKK